MTDLTEYGDVMINAYMDEWGFRKIDGLLEDGTAITIVVPPVKKPASSIIPLIRGMDLLQISKRFPKLKPRLVI